MLQDFTTIENNHRDALAVTLDQLKKQCDMSVAVTEVDDLLTTYLLVSQEQYEKHTNDILFPRKISCIETSPSRSNLLTVGPIQSVDAVFAVDSNLNETQIDQNDYAIFEGHKSLVQFKSRFAGLPWRLRYHLTVGYATTADIPHTAKQAIMLLAYTRYQYRGDLADNNTGQRASIHMMNHTSRKRGRFE